MNEQTLYRLRDILQSTALASEEAGLLILLLIWMGYRIWMEI